MMNMNDQQAVQPQVARPVPPAAPPAARPVPPAAPPAARPVPPAAPPAARPVPPATPPAARPVPPAAPPAAWPVPPAAPPAARPVPPAAPPPATPYGYAQPPSAGGAVPGSPSVSPPGRASVGMQYLAGWNGWAVASLLIGIISLMSWLMPWLGVLLSIVGIVLGHRGRRLPVGRGMATTGLVLSYITLGLGVLHLLAGVMLHLH